MSIQCPSKGPKLAGNPCQGIGGKIGRENHTCDGRTVTSFNVAPANWKFKVWGCLVKVNIPINKKRKIEKKY